MRACIVCGAIHERKRGTPFCSLSCQRKHRRQNDDEWAQKERAWNKDYYERNKERVIARVNRNYQPRGRPRGRPSGGGPAPKKLADIKQMRADGMTLKQIGEKYSVTKQAVSMFLKYWTNELDQ